MKHYLVEVAVVDCLTTGGSDPSTVDLPLLLGNSPGVEVGGFLVAAEPADQRQDRCRHSTARHSDQGSAMLHGQWRRAVRLNLFGGDALGDSAQKTRNLGTLCSSQPR